MDHPTVSRTSPYRIALLFFALICGMVGLLCFEYYKQLQATVKEESGEYLQEISKQICVNVSKNFNDNFAVLGTIASLLHGTNITSFAQLQPIVKEQQLYWNYQKILLIDKDGATYDSVGEPVLFVGKDALQATLARKERAMLPAQMISGTKCILFTIPLNQIFLDGKEITALATSYPLNEFDQILSMTAFNGKGYAHVVQSNGAVILRSTSPYAPQTGYNILNSLRDAAISDQKTVEDIQAEMATGKSGQVVFTLDQLPRYMAYTPLGIEGWYLTTFVPVSVVNAKSELLFRITLLISGFITLSFAGLLAFLMISFYQNRRKLEQIAYVDPITGGHTIQRFYDLARPSLEKEGNRQYALVYVNVEKFKVLNEQFGRDSCDDVLRGIQISIEDDLLEDEYIGHLFADNFCLVIEHTEEISLAVRFNNWHTACLHSIEANGLRELPLTLEFGVFLIENRAMSFPSMIDRAKLALREIPNQAHGKFRYAVYTEQMHHRLLRETYLEDRMESALKNEEFQVYLQPKYLVKTEEIGGAEALVRWQTKEDGMIYPDEFISLFEKNGFIVQLDLWVFEEVCRTLRRWLDTAQEPVTISVNCSRVHLNNPAFLQQYRAIFEKYDLPPALIEIELTENIVFEDVKHLTCTIDNIHAEGFSCSMDDFGSGYSSLNLIRDIPVDILKLDKVFFRDSENLDRTESVVGSIISMARALSMKTVAEGVENRLQVDMLKRLNCDYIQGYYFAKPMPIKDFELLRAVPAAIFTQD